MAYGTNSGWIPNSVHESHGWRISEITSDFNLEDVWQLPTRGRDDEFPAMVETVVAAFESLAASSRPARLLLQARHQLGRWFRWDNGEKPRSIPGVDETSLTVRLPEDLRSAGSITDFGALPFSLVYSTDVEAAAELSNGTVHGVVHLSWVDDGRDHRGELAIYVKPNGWWGAAYMQLIKPFRYAVVYPALLRQIERNWEARGADR